VSKVLKLTKARLSDFRGKWILSCFYPEDFTYVYATEVAGIIRNYEFAAIWWGRNPDLEK